MHFFTMIFLFIFLSLNLFAETNPIQEGAQDNKTLYIFFYKEKNERTNRSEEIFNQAIQNLGNSVRSIKINVNDPSSKPFNEKFDLKRTPMPFVIVLAPNGAITGGFNSFTKEQLQASLTSQCTAECLKALQEKKLVLLSVQNSKTPYNKEAMKGINEFKADPRFASATVIIPIDPSDSKEHPFLNQLGVNPSSNEAVTILMAPPGEIIGKYQGPTSKTQMINDIQKASAGCCPGGCCPGGCCPGGKCGP